MDFYLPSLAALSEKYRDKIRKKTGKEPFVDGNTEMTSPCILKNIHSGSYWRPVRRENADFSAVERGIGFTLNEDIKRFYGSLYSADLPVIYKGLKMELIQVWSDDDFIRLQENILGHLVMLDRLKLTPTVFIATVKDDRKIISIDNDSGNILYEFIGSPKRIVIETLLHDFIGKLTVNY